MRLHDHELPDWTREARDDELEEFDALTIALDDEHPPTEDWRQLAQDAGAVDALLARANMDIRQLEFESRFFHDKNPALWTGEAIFSVVALMLRPPASITDGVASMAMRMHEIPRFLADMPGTITEPMPAPWVARAVRECQAASRLMRSGVSRWLADHPIDADTVVWLQEAAEVAALAFDEARQWLEAQPEAPSAPMAIGADAYALLLARGHFCTETPGDLLDRVLAELPEAQARFAALADEVAGGPDALAAALAADHPSVEGYLQAYRDQWVACRRLADSHDLVEWGDLPVQYTPFPAWARDIAPDLYFLFYRSPAPYEPPTEHAYLVTPVDATLAPEEQARRVQLWNHSAITLNHVVHHGALGHHVQNWHAIHRSTSRLGTIAAVDCASRIGMFQGGTMAEGWACYATELADELGFLTPLAQASEQQSRVRMLARAIVDIRLHTGAWSIHEAEAFYVQEVGMPRAAAIGEVVKNTMFPGTAVMYWLGTQRILQLRAELRSRVGAAFSLRRFHDALLRRGSIPVPLAAHLLLAESL